MKPQQKTPGQIAFEAALETRPDRKEFGITWESSASHANHASWEAAALAVLAAQWRPVSEPPEDESKVVLLAGGGLGVAELEFNRRSSKRTHWLETPPLPQPPIDPYAELRQAHAAGKVIQFETSKDLWVVDRTGVFNHSPDRYRVKPWELSRHLPGFRPLEPGEEWHRGDFTEGMLPEGWRPLLLGESEVGTELQYWCHGTWQLQATFGEAFETDWPRRTRRPLPPTKQELERKEFEEWFKLTKYSAHHNWRACFEAWQAARKQPTQPNP